MDREGEQGVMLPAHALSGGHERQREGEDLSKTEDSLSVCELRSLDMEVSRLQTLMRAVFSTVVPSRPAPHQGLL